MSNTNVKPGKISLREMMANTPGYKKAAVKVSSSAAPSGKAAWADIVEEDKTTEAVALLERYYKETRVNIRRNQLLYLTRYRLDNFKHIRDLRFFVMERPTQMSSSIPANDLLELLQPFKARRDEKNIQFPFIFSYSPVTFQPLDFAYWQMVLHRCPDEMLAVGRDHVYLLPTLGAMVAKIRAVQPIFNTVKQKNLKESVLMTRALAHFNSEFTIEEGKKIPKIADFEYRPTASPGSPYNQMARLNVNKPVTRIEQCFTPTWAIAEIQDFVKLFAKSSNPPDLEAAKAHWTWQMAAGNCKIIKRSEVSEGKPDRAIFQSPLFMRVVGGCLTQAYQSAVDHPGFLKHFSWAYGGALRLVDKITARVQSLTGLKEGDDYTWSFASMPEDELRQLGLDDGVFYMIHTVSDDENKSLVFSFPDVKSWDLTAPPVYYDHHEERTQKFIEKCDTTPGLKALWKRISSWLTRKTREARIQTNSSIVFNLTDRVMSGGARTYIQNTEGNLTGRIALDMYAWEKLHPNVEFIPFEANFACGDDLLAATASRYRKHLERANAAVTEVLGQQYKPETLGIYDSLSSQPFLGRHIVGFEMNGQRAIVAIRPWRSILASVLFAKHNPPKGVSHYSYALVRLSAAWDEGALFYPRLRRFFSALWDALLASGAQWPTQSAEQLVDSDKYFVDAEGSPIPPSPVLRSLGDLWHLHTGQEAVASDEETPAPLVPDEEDLGDLDIMGFDNLDLEESEIPASELAESKTTQTGLKTPAPPTEEELEVEEI